MEVDLGTVAVEVGHDIVVVAALDAAVVEVELGTVVEAGLEIVVVEVELDLLELAALEVDHETAAAEVDSETVVEVEGDFLELAAVEVDPGPVAVEVKGDLLEIAVAVTVLQNVVVPETVAGAVLETEAAGEEVENFPVETVADCLED